MANLKTLLQSLLRQSPTTTSAPQRPASDSTPTASRARRIQPNEFDPVEFVGTMNPQPDLPEMPTYQPHEKHGFLDRMSAAFKSSRRDGVGGFIEGLRRPEIQEQQDWQRNTLSPAMAQRQMLAREADAQADRQVKIGQLLSQLMTSKANQLKAETDARKLEDKGEFLTYFDPTTQQHVPLMIEGKPVRHSSVATATVNQDGQLRKQQETNKGNLEREGARGKNNMAVEQERSNRARYVANTAANSRIGAAQIGANARTASAQISAGARSSKQSVPKFFDDDDIADLAANEFKGQSPEQIRHMLEMKGLKFKPKPQ